MYQLQFSSKYANTENIMPKENLPPQVAKAAPIYYDLVKYFAAGQETYDAWYECKSYL